jgi:hypothetical protein
MEESQELTRARRTKLSRRLSDEGVKVLPGWFADWVYWNTGFYKLPGAPRVREQFKYHKPIKKYGIDAPVIVYQMGRVGSTSMYRALARLDLDVPVFHAHALKYLEANGQARAPVDPRAGLHLPPQERVIRPLLDQNVWKRWNLVSLIRTPIPRAISSYFHELWQGHIIPNFKERFARNEISSRELAADFVENYQGLAPDEWFDREVRDVFGIDVYASPFAKERGYQVYEDSRARLVVMRLEDLDRIAAPAMREFLHIPQLALVPVNRGETTAYGELYKEFLSTLGLPDAYIEKANNTRYARHFYTQEELAQSVARWAAGG